MCLIIIVNKGVIFTSPVDYLIQTAVMNMLLQNIHFNCAISTQSTGGIIGPLEGATARALSRTFKQTVSSPAERVEFQNTATEINNTQPSLAPGMRKQLHVLSTLPKC